MEGLRSMSLEAFHRMEARRSLLVAGQRYYFDFIDSAVHPKHCRVISAQCLF
jgi:hypothetical protein